jgi:bifunctional UDP-N-acetylglucosamine pyrophosphorylase/glucosamine-1-phosphate N-acetyltransferase
MVECVILAAGEGKRGHPLTYTRPKVMLPVANKPLIEWNLINAIKAGLKEFVFVVAYKSEMVRNYFGNGEKYKVKIEYVNQGEPKGTAHAISVVERFVDDFIVLSGDTVFGVNDIKNVIMKKNSMGLFKVEDVNEYGLVEINNDKVVKIYEKMDDSFTDIINAGIYHFDSKVFDFIRRTGKSMRGEYEITDTINMMAEKSMVSGVMLKQWRDVVYPWHLLDANMEVLKKLDKKIKGTVEENVTIKNKVVIGKNTVIMNGCYIEGPVVIGSNCKIGPNCYIRPFTSIGDGCHIGNACEVKNSIVFDGSNIPHQNYVGDSIIGSGCNFGAGSKIANLRFDKKNIMVTLNGKKIDSKRHKLGVVMGDHVQTGINSMMNVGTMVGDHVFIGPGAVVSGEITSFSHIL